METDEGGRLITPIVRVTYDCANIKAALRCIPHGIDFSDLLFDVGSVPASRYGEMAEKGDFSELPKNLAAAAEKAKTDYATTCDPLKIDLPLDRACFAAMLEDAKASRVGLAVQLVERKIDLTNLLTCVRLLRMNAKEAGRAMLENALLDGGLLSCEYLVGLYDGGEAYLWEGLEYSPYERFALTVNGTASTLTEVECAADNFFMALIREAKKCPYGAEPLMGYLLASEFESRNLRILLAAFELGLSTQTVRERMRDCYV